MTAPATLASPLTLPGGQTLKNRLFKSAMSEQLGTLDFAPSKSLLRLYRTWADGGIGLMVTGNVMIDSNALGEPRNVVLENDQHLGKFRAWADAGQQNGAKIWMQLNHPGKQIPAFLSKEPLAPSAIPLGAGLDKAFNTPRALTDAEIQDIIERFARSAALAQQAKFDGVQIHGAHGYLVSQFLSPRHNQRDDQWGGSLENRMRFALEVYRAMRKAVGPDFPIGIKLNAADFMKGGFSIEEACQVAKALSDEGMNLIEISGGNYETPSMTGFKQRTEREAYFLEAAEQIKAHVNCPLVVTGGFRSGPAMNAALASGATDMIGLARPLAVMPDFPNELLWNSDYQIDLERPSTGSKTLDRFAMLDVTWYELQLARIGQGKAPALNMGAWSAAAQTIAFTGINAFRRRRA